MSSEFEHTTYQDDEWPGVPENNEDADFDATDDDEDDDWHSATGWATAGDRTEVLINQGRTSARGRRATGRRASGPQLGGLHPGGSGLGNQRHDGPRLYGPRLGGSRVGGLGRGRNGWVPGGVGIGGGPAPAPVVRGPAARCAGWPS